VDYKHTYDLSFGFRSVVSYDSFGFYLSPFIRYSFSDRISITGGYDMLSGDSLHFFGHFGAEDRLTFKLSLLL